MAEHTESFKKAVEGCKRENPGFEAGKCFAMVTETFKEANKPIFVKKAGLETAQIETFKVTFASDLEKGEVDFLLSSMIRHRNNYGKESLLALANAAIAKVDAANAESPGNITDEG